MLCLGSILGLLVGYRAGARDGKWAMTVEKEAAEALLYIEILESAKKNAHQRSVEEIRVSTYTWALASCTSFRKKIQLPWLLPDEENRRIDRPIEELERQLAAAKSATQAAVGVP